MNDASFLADVCSVYNQNIVHDNMRDTDMGSTDREDGGDRGIKRPDSDDDDEDNKHLRLMSADEQRRYLRENHSQIEKRRRDKMNTHIKA